MGRVKFSFIIALLAWSVTAAGPASGQIVYGQPASAKLRVIMTSWETSSEGVEKSLDQMYVPFSGFIPLQENLEARIFLGGVNNKLDDPEGTKKLSGPTDMRIQINKLQEAFTNLLALL